MDYSKILTPLIGRGEIKKKADDFREKHWDSKIPIDIEKIIEIKLKIDIVPVPDLGKICSEALITSDWSTLYVDKDLYEDDRRQNRLRFSYAHEIGHFILHRDLYNSFKINSFVDFYNFLSKIPQEQYRYIEIQAQKFASLLLIPRGLLKDKFDIELLRIKDLPNLRSVDKEILKSYLSNPLSKLFGVSAEAMEIALSELFKE